MSPSVVRYRLVRKRRKQVAARVFNARTSREEMYEIAPLLNMPFFSVFFISPECSYECIDFTTTFIFTTISLFLVEGVLRSWHEMPQKV